MLFCITSMPHTIEPMFFDLHLWKTQSSLCFLSYIHGRHTKTIVFCLRQWKQQEKPDSLTYVYVYTNGDTKDPSPVVGSLRVALGPANESEREQRRHLKRPPENPREHERTQENFREPKRTQEKPREPKKTH